MRVQGSSRTKESPLNLHPRHNQEDSEPAPLQIYNTRLTQSGQFGFQAMFLSIIFPTSKVGFTARSFFEFECRWDSSDQLLGLVGSAASHFVVSTLRDRSVAVAHDHMQVCKCGWG